MAEIIAGEGSENTVQESLQKSYFWAFNVRL
jgi:hypothetical protein